MCLEIEIRNSAQNRFSLRAFRASGASRKHPAPRSARSSRRRCCWRCSAWPLRLSSSRCVRCISDAYPMRIGSDSAVLGDQTVAELPDDDRQAGKRVVVLGVPGMVQSPIPVHVDPLQGPGPCLQISNSMWKMSSKIRSKAWHGISWPHSEAESRLKVHRLGEQAVHEGLQGLQEPNVVVCLLPAVLRQEKNENGLSS